MSPAHEGGPWGGSAFGVRRPLRFLAAKLELDDTQVRRLAEILDELKTERAQAAVDDRRTLTAFAESVAGETFDASRATGGAALRQESADRVGQAVVSALERIHAVLRPDQRERFAYLIRTGVVAL
jgi:Spy/CpxP family protein refolding chaperone